MFFGDSVVVHSEVQTYLFPFHQLKLDLISELLGESERFFVPPKIFQ